MPRLRYRDAGNVRSLTPALWDSAFLRTCRGEPAPHTPVWLMRQAGRYMAHYRGIRSTRSFLELCKEPAAAAEVTIFARDWLGVDAAIIFSDILVTLEALGLPLSFSTGDGPVLGSPIKGRDAVEALRDPAQAAADLEYVHEAIRLTVRGLPADIPLIGFCGAPFTLAAYAIEGGSSRQFARTRAFMYRETAAWHRLMSVLVDTLAPYLTAQITAGASAVQVFDSWVGNLTRADFIEFVQPHLTALVARIPTGVPVILFGTCTNHLLDLITACGADVIGMDAATDLDASWRALGGPSQIAVQGNLDPALLLADPARLDRSVDAVLAAAAGRPGHIFNLGHGILKETDPEMAKRLVDRVHAQTNAR
jgi:uroporphyrinogen decarboxylase